MNSTTTDSTLQQDVPVISIWQKITRSRSAKTIVMYLTMVAVSTVAIFLLEHASLVNAFRTATVAAIAKTIAANWVSGLFS